MTAVALPRPQRTLQAVASRARAWRCSVRVAVLALTVVAFHIVDDSFLQPQPGTGGVEGYLDSRWANLSVLMPTNTIDYSAGPSGIVWPNSYIGQWYF